METVAQYLARIGNRSIESAPTDGTPVILTLTDGLGPYGFGPCVWLDGAWRNAQSGQAISPKVIGWRPTE